jgi:peptidoglycan/xylan/chitin deacetylase (PgdA/CDA1 family)
LKYVLEAPELVAKRRPGPRLLIYHQVGTNLGREMEVSTELFTAQIDHLTREGHIVSLTDAVERTGTANDDRLFVLTFDDGYADFYRNGFGILAERGIPFTLYLTTEPIEDQASAFGHPDAVPLSWDQVAEMAATGLMTIGAHTHTHPDLRFLDRAAVAEELDTSNGLIEERLGVQPRHFAYPKGWWAESAELELRPRYDTAVLGEGPPITPETDPLRLHRIAVQKTDGLRFFKRKLDTGLVLEERIRRVARRYHGPPKAARATT